MSAEGYERDKSGSTSQATLFAIEAQLMGGMGIKGIYTPFHGEVSSADASLGVEFGLYPGGSVAAHTLLATEYILISDVIVAVTNAGKAGVYAAADSAGRRVAVHPAVPASGGFAQHMHPGHLCPVGVVPKLIAVAGAVNGVIHGFIITPA